MPESTAASNRRTPRRQRARAVILADDAGEMGDGRGLLGAAGPKLRPVNVALTSSRPFTNSPSRCSNGPPLAKARTPSSGGELRGVTCWPSPRSGTGERRAKSL